MAAEGRPIQVACRVLEVPESSYFDWRSRPPSARSIRHVWLTDMITQVHAASRGTYGHRRVHAELTLGQGISVGHTAVEMLMRRAGIKGIVGNPRRKHIHQIPTATDLVERKFARAAPNQLWVTDITEHRTREGKIYCAVVLDAYSRRVVGWSIDSSPTSTLVTNALGMAISNRSPSAGGIIHSDHGTQSIHVVGLHPPGQGVRSAPIHGVHWRLLRQRDDRELLGSHAGRTLEPEEVADPPRARQRHLRVPRDIPQPPASSQLDRDAHPHRV